MISTGAKQSSGLSNIDLILIIIAVFCGCIVVFVGFICCRKKKPGKRKAFQRKRRSTNTSGSIEEVSPLQSNSQSDSSTNGNGAALPSRQNRKVSPSPESVSLTSSILRHIRGGLREQRDVEHGHGRQKIVKYNNNKQARKKKKNKETQANDNLTSMNSEREKLPSIDLSLPRGGSIELMEISPPASKNSGNTSKGGNSPRQYSKDIKRKCTSVECPGRACKKCKPFREDEDLNSCKQATDSFKQEKTYNPIDHASDHDEYVVINAPTKSDLSKNELPWAKVDITKTGHNETITVSEIKINDDDDVEMEADSPCLHGELGELDQPDSHFKNTSTDEVAKIKYPPNIKKDDKNDDAKLLLRIDKGQNMPKNVPGVSNIGDVFDIKEYATREWRGDTTKAETIRKGYFDIPNRLDLHNLRIVRGDNYCGIRATLFQALVQNTPILEHFPDNIQQIPEQLMAQDCIWIEEWTFGKRIVTEDETCETMKECLGVLSKLVSLSSKMMNKEGRESHLLSSFNFQEPLFEVRLMEAVKLLMLASAIKLHKLMCAGKDVPVFAMIMFARDTSENPYHFMKKHLNAVGDSGGLEQVEMHLLGYTLGTTIRVVRPSQCGQEDFIACYPDDMLPGTPLVTLVAEDDRHYNILT